MADKPKTYAQQAAELKTELEQKNALIAELQQRLSFVEEMQSRIADLETKLVGYRSAAQQSGVSNKAQFTDAIQRAESAEQGLRNAQALIRELETVKESLETQLNVQAIERDKEVGKDKKLLALEEVIKGLNFQIAQLQQRNHEIDAQKDKQINGMEMANRNLRAALEQRDNQISSIFQRIQEFNLTKSLGY